MITQLEILRYLDKSCTAWITARVFKPGQYCVNDSVIYEITAEHTSGVFADDLAAGKLSANTLALQCMNNAISDVNDYCNRDFRSNTYTHEFKGNGKNYTWVNNSPATAVSAVEYLNESTGNEITIFTAPDDATNSVKLFDGSGKIMLLKDYVFSSEYFYKVSYTGGYTSELMPGVIKQVTLEKAAWNFKLADGSGGGLLGLSSTNLGGQSSQGKGIDPAALTEKHNNILDKFRMVNV